MRGLLTGGEGVPVAASARGAPAQGPIAPPSGPAPTATSADQRHADRT